MRARVGKLAGTGCALALLASLLAAVPAMARTGQSAKVLDRVAGTAMVANPSTALQAVADPVIDLCARTGSVTMPDGVGVPIWGSRSTPAVPAAQPSCPARGST